MVMETRTTSVRRAERVAEIVSRFFSWRDATVKKLDRSGVFLCPVCDVFTDDAEKHRHEDPVY
jgi:uncharacterized membrane protein